MNPDYRDILSELSAAGAEFVIVGAYAMAAHGNPRATGDIDIWIRPARDNATRVMEALERFGAPTTELSTEDLSRPGLIFQIGVAPRRVDILTSVEAVDFDEAWENRLEATIDGLGWQPLASLLAN